MKKNPTCDVASNFTVQDRVLSFWKQEKIACLISFGLFLLILFVFSPGLKNGFINFDDPVYILENPHVVTGLKWANVEWAFTSGYAANWHPLTWLSHQLDFQLFGYHASGHHLTSVFFHALNTVLVFVLFLRMTGRVGASCCLAALFGVHPLRVESVLWVAERKDVLCAFFGLLSLWAYVVYVQGSKLETRPQACWRYRSYLASLIFLALGLLCKPMLVTWPFVMLLLDLGPLVRERSGTRKIFPWDRALLEKIPFLTLAILSCLITYWVQNSGGAVQQISNFPMDVRFENALVSYFRYLGCLFYPVNLCVFYPHPGEWPAAGVTASGLTLVAVSVGAMAWRRAFPWVFTGWFWFLGTLLPVIGLVQVGSQSMADRYTYLPLLGVLYICVWGGASLLTNARSGDRGRSVVAGLLVLVCIFLTVHQARYWANSGTVFTRALAVTENNAVAHINLGAFLAQEGKFEVAQTELEEAIRLAPEESGAYLSLGSIFVEKKRFSDAIALFRKGVELKPENPNAHFLLGCALVKLGQVPESIPEFEQVVVNRPDFVDGYVNLGASLRRMGRLDEAIIIYQKALEKDPRHADAHNNLAIALGMKGQNRQALEHFQKSVELNPKVADVQANLGLMLDLEGRVEEAKAAYERALNLEPHHALAEHNLNRLQLKKNSPPP
jgi:tetratricopeptide (TPR) repeat protein